jgi:hypothetical protein
MKRKTVNDQEDACHPQHDGDCADCRDKNVLTQRCIAICASTNKRCKRRVLIDTDTCKQHQITSKITHEKQSLCQVSHKTTKTLVYRMRQVRGDGFVDVGCPGTIARIEEFTLAFADKQMAWRTYLDALPHSQNNAGLQNLAINAAWLLMALVFGAKDECLEGDYALINMTQTHNLVFYYDISSEIITCDEEGCLAQILRRKCGSKKRAIVNLSLYFEQNDHQNLLVVDFEKHTFLVIEPHGSCASKFTPIVTQRLQSALGPAFTQDTLACFCKYEKGPQYYDERNGGGYCVSWSLLFLLLQLAQPDETAMSIYKNIQKYMSTSELYDLIRKFTTLMELMVPEPNSITDLKLLHHRSIKSFSRYKLSPLKKTNQSNCNIM